MMMMVLLLPPLLRMLLEFVMVFLSILETESARRIQTKMAYQISNRLRNIVYRDSEISDAFQNKKENSTR